MNKLLYTLVCAFCICISSTVQSQEVVRNIDAEEALLALENLAAYSEPEFRQQMISILTVSAGLLDEENFSEADQLFQLLVIISSKKFSGTAHPIWPYKITAGLYFGVKCFENRAGDRCARGLQLLDESADELTALSQYNDLILVTSMISLLRRDLRLLEDLIAPISNADDDVALARLYLTLGDYRLLLSKTSKAHKYYKLAWQHMDSDLRVDYFSTPISLEGIGGEFSYHRRGRNVDENAKLFADYSFTVKASGSVAKLRIVDTTDPDKWKVRAARYWVRQVKFRPALRDGIPVDYENFGRRQMFGSSLNALDSESYYFMPDLRKAPTYSERNYGNPKTFSLRLIDE